MNGLDSAGLTVWAPSHRTTGGVLAEAEIGGEGRMIPRGDFHCGPGSNTRGPTVSHHFQCDGGRGSASLVDLSMWETNWAWA